VKRQERKTNLLRCAIYTRVSTEQGLEQEFNSLDNQREASEAYIKSQAHEGWRLNRDRYDDGGFSGGSMERPALQKLLDDVRARRIDVIVVYKVDRLTRSLADFAKLVELFDEHAVSFISVTQSFNTTTSMGRLTLNMLLSFAQFEREITGERIRDKVAASKKKGIWMGGAVPIGYRVENRALYVVEDQADFVRDLFRRYLNVGSVVRLKVVLDAQNVRLPIRTAGTGRKTGGGLISRGHIYHILSNPIYSGRLRHKGEVHEGLHETIVDEDIWSRVQDLLAEQTQRRKAPSADSHSFLAGKLFDDRGHRMGPSHAAKGGRRWRYYISRAVLKGRSQDAGSVTRVPAAEIEKQVSQAVRSFLPSPERNERGRGFVDRSISTSSGKTNDRPTAANTNMPHPEPSNIDDRVRDAIERVMVGKAGIEIRLSEAAASDEGQYRILTIPWTPPSPYRRREIIQGEGEASSVIRPMRARARAVFVEALGDAHRWLDELTHNSAQTLETLAAREGKTERSIHDAVTGFRRAAYCRGGARWTPAARIWSSGWRAVNDPPSRPIVWRLCAR
jgi:DNA invertase Pin-like site-specific DNA recombinase